MAAITELASRLDYKETIIGRNTQITEELRSRLSNRDIPDWYNERGNACKANTTRYTIHYYLITKMYIQVSSVYQRLPLLGIQAFVCMYVCFLRDHIENNEIRARTNVNDIAQRIAKHKVPTTDRNTHFRLAKPFIR